MRNTTIRATLAIMSMTVGGNPAAVSGDGACGTFGDATVYGVGAEPRTVAVGDLDGDFDLDLAITNKVDQTVSVFLNNGDGIFAAPVLYAAGGQAWGLVMADLDGDLDLDLATGNQGSNSVSVFMNNGDGTFAPQVAYAAGAQPRFVAVADLDGDLDLDLVPFLVSQFRTVAVMPPCGIVASLGS